jgi:hypothetical protein
MAIWYILWEFGVFFPCFGKKNLATLGSMLWSQFSSIFANFRQKLAFSQKPMLWSQFLHNLALLWVKNANFFAIFSAKILQKS